MEIKNKFFLGGLFSVILISAIAHWQWLFVPGILTASDWWYTPNDVFKEYLTAPKILEGAIDFNPGRATPTFDLLRIIGGFIAFYFHAFPIWERLLFLWPIALLGPIPIYTVLYRRFSSTLGAISGTLIYSCNSYILAREISHIHIAVAYLLFTPLLFLALDSLLSRPAIKTGALFTLTAIAFSVYEIRILYIISIMLMLYVLYQFITKSATPSYRLFSIAQLSVIIIILAQSFWLIPFIFSRESLGYATFTERGLFQSFGEIKHAITLSDPSWTGKGYIPFTTEPVQPFLYIIPLLAICWVAIKPKDEPTKDLWFWIAVAGIGIFLTKGQNPPFPDAYPWIFDHVPGFRLFRESAKFSVLIGFSYAILIAASVKFLQKRNRVLTTLCVVLIGVYAAINILPFVSGSIKDLTTPYAIPDAYASFQKLVTADSNFSRSLWLPSTERFIYYSEKHPRVDAGTVLSQEWKSFTQNQADPYSFFTQPNAKALLDFGSIRYIGVPSDTTKEIYQWFSRSKKNFASLIETIPGLHSISSSDAEIPLWENKDAKDRIYIANDVTFVDSTPLEFSNLDTNKAGAFLFQPDVPGYLYSLLRQTLATNQEARPFNINNITIGTDQVRTVLDFSKEKNLRTTEQISSKDIIAEIFVKKSNDEFSLFIKTDGTDREIAAWRSTSSTFFVIINEKSFPLFESESTEQSLGVARIKPAGNRVEIYNRTETGNTLIKDPSFEQGLPSEVGDCNNQDGSSLESSGIAASLVSTATDGTHALSLTAKKHIGCIVFPINQSKNATLYTVDFDYQSIAGSPGSVRILSDSSPANELAYKDLEKSSTWSHATISFQTPSTNETKSILYIYQPGSIENNIAANSLFDNIQVNAYQLLEEKIFDAMPEKERVSTRDFQETDTAIKPAYPYKPTNVVVDGTFEQGKPYVAGDCNNINQTLPEKNGITASIVEDADGHALALKAWHHLACVSMDLAPLDPTFDYLISMRYKHIHGAPPSLTLYSHTPKPLGLIELPKQKDESWHEFRTIVQGSKVPTDAQLMLYVSAETVPSEAMFDTITMTPIPMLPELSITSANPPLPAIMTETQTINPLIHIIKSEHITSNRLLVLSSRYDTGWKLFVRPQGVPPLSWWKRILQTPPGTEISAQTHIKANAFVNGWVLDPAEIQNVIGQNASPEFIIEYWPQRFMDAGRTISLTTLGVYIGGLILLLIRKEIKDFKEHIRSNNNANFPK